MKKWLAVLLCFALIHPLNAARNFDLTDDSCNVNATAVTSAPLSVSAWFRSTDVTAAQTIVWIGDKDSDADYWRLMVRGDVGGDPLEWASRDSTTNTNARTSTSYTTNTWYHGCGVEASSTSRTVYLNGAGVGTDTTSASPAAVDRTRIGEMGDSTSPFFPFGGAIGEVTVFNIALTAQQCKSLSEKTSPWRVASHAIVGYWPLGHGSPEPDWSGNGNNCTVTGATITDHPPVAPYFGSLWEKFDLWAGFISGWRYAFGG